jgi:hypothetical protein
LINSMILSRTDSQPDNIRNYSELSQIFFGLKVLLRSPCSLLKK